MVVEFPDTIAAIATAAGNGGVGIVRISGFLAEDIAEQICHKPLAARTAHFVPFKDQDGRVIDTGIALFFPSPASYTGEDVLELQAHGGSVVLNMLLRRVLALGARLAAPGEFTERAYLNGKLDLAQAEAVADLINASTEQATRSAQNSLQGLFSRYINELLEELTELRVYIEAAIDFVDEDIDFLGDGVIQDRMIGLMNRVRKIQQTARQGRLLQNGMNVVIAGKPNAGKSSLLNCLAGHEAAIVNDMAGTTRDVVRERIELDGMPLNLIDTAGLRDAGNAVEQEGIRRTRAEINKADKILFLIDVTDLSPQTLGTDLPGHLEVIRVYNKIDLLGLPPIIKKTGQGTEIYLSVKTEAGIFLLKEHLKECAGYNAACEQVFTARTRHLEALQQALNAIGSALSHIQHRAGDLAAEDLRQAQNHLAEITGQFSPDDLLGKIFSSFCIGK